MRNLFLSGAAALALGVTGAYAQSTTAPAADPSSNMASGAHGAFIGQQEAGTFRAPKLVGVAVYDNTNKDIGKISDLLLDKDGQVKSVVISVGGFLGIGTKDVAVPFSALKWQTEQRTATNDTAGSGSVTGTANTANTDNGAMKPATSANSAPKMTTAQAEAYQGYPDRAVIDMSQAELKAAPDFKYASSTGAAATKQP